MAFITGDILIISGRVPRTRATRFWLRPFPICVCIFSLRESLGLPVTRMISLDPRESGLVLQDSIDFIGPSSPPRLQAVVLDDVGVPIFRDKPCQRLVSNQTSKIVRNGINVEFSRHLVDSCFP